MSKKLVVLIGSGGIALAAFAWLVAAPGCSSSSSSNTALCEKICNKTASCLSDGGAGGSTTAACMQSCTSVDAGTDTTHCTNASAITSKVNECVAVSDCTMYESCLQSIPPCQTSGGGGGSTGEGGSNTTGGAGTSGGGGSTGAGGSGTSASCDPCTKADACCNAVGGATNGCQFAVGCNAQTGSNRDIVISSCNSYTQAVVQTGAAPQACQ